MKIIIHENERGFLFKNGTYRELLLPGKHSVRAFTGETFVRAPLEMPVRIPGADAETLLRDPDFAAAVVKIDVPDGKVAVRFEDGRVAGAHTAGKYLYFNPYGTISFELFDTVSNEIEGLTPEQIERLPKELYVKGTVERGEVCLLYIDGRFSRLLQPGAYYFWNTRANLTWERVDLRSQQIAISGQEILTFDKVSLRINFVADYRVTDAVKLASVKDHKDRVYTAVQLVLRKHVGKYRFDELLEQKDTIADSVLSELKELGEELFVEFTGAGLKDIILPGEIRDIMNTVLVAEKNAQANVIARREEVASTRSLLNTAKLLDENATLYKLKQLEYLERICDKVGSISVGGGDLLTELQKIVGG